MCSTKNHHPQTDPLIMNKTLNNQALSGKPKQGRCCPFCSRPLIICYGFYDRDHPERGELIKVQRYLCKAPGCPVKTFSIPPYPLPRIVRHVIRTIEKVHTMAKARVSQAYIKAVRKQVAGSGWGAGSQ